MRRLLSTLTWCLYFGFRGGFYLLGYCFAVYERVSNNGVTVAVLRNACAAGRDHVIYNVTRL